MRLIGPFNVISIVQARVRSLHRRQPLNNKLRVTPMVGRLLILSYKHNPCKSLSLARPYNHRTSLKNLILQRYTYHRNSGSAIIYRTQYRLRSSANIPLSTYVKIGPRSSLNNLKTSIRRRRKTRRPIHLNINGYRSYRNTQQRTHHGFFTSRTLRKLKNMIKLKRITRTPRDFVLNTNYVHIYIRL